MKKVAKGKYGYGDNNKFRRIIIDSLRVRFYKKYT